MLTMSKDRTEENQERSREGEVVLPSFGLASSHFLTRNVMRRLFAVMACGHTCLQIGIQGASIEQAL